VCAARDFSCFLEPISQCKGRSHSSGLGLRVAGCGLDAGGVGGCFRGWGGGGVCVYVYVCGGGVCVYGE
jgi:hypothetical protein